MINEPTTRIDNIAVYLPVMLKSDFERLKNNEGSPLVTSGVEALLTLLGLCFLSILERGTGIVNSLHKIDLVVLV